MITLYHGSNQSIGRIDLTKSKPNKDFGRGFYLSDDYQQALAMAKFKALTIGGTPIISSFSFDERLLKTKTLNVRIFSNYSEEWADFVLFNRTKSEEDQSYDIVYGPIADDRIGLQIRKLQDGAIDKAEFLNRLKYMKGITFQYMFGTETATGYLIKID